jgi:hypothetical protein
VTVGLVTAGLVTVGLVTVPSPGPSCDEVRVTGEVTVTGGSDETVVVVGPPPPGPGPSLPPTRVAGAVVSPEPRWSSVPVVEPPLLRCVAWRSSIRTVATGGAGVAVGNTT